MTCKICDGSGQHAQDKIDAARWRVFKNRDAFDNIDFDMFCDRFREDADVIVDAAIRAASTPTTLTEKKE